MLMRRNRNAKAPIVFAMLIPLFGLVFLIVGAVVTGKMAANKKTKNSNLRIIKMIYNILQHCIVLFKFQPLCIPKIVYLFRAIKNKWDPDNHRKHYTELPYSLPPVLTQLPNSVPYKQK